MCSVVQDDFQPESVEVIKPNIRLNSDCKKCSEKKAVIVLQKRHCYCKACFLNMVTHKFRSTLGKTKLMKHDEKVLTLFYGDQNSVAVLHLLEQGVSENTHKKIRFKPTILYIDESALWSSKVDKAQVLDGVWKSLKSSFDCYIIKLGSVYGNYAFENLNNIELSNFIELDESDNKLRSHFHSIKSPTSKIDFILRLRYLIQVEIARKLQCTKIFTPDCGTDLSIRLLSDVILGRGSQISSDISVCDTKLSDVYTMRPLREITSKEVTFYNIFNELECAPVPSITAMFNSSNSIQQVAESFIYDLQEEFPSTVYTVFHTGEKLKTEQNRDQENTCVMCYNRIDSSKFASISRLEPTTDKNKKSCDNCSCDSKKLQLDEIKHILQNNLCYGCHRLVNDMDTLEGLPDNIVQKAKLKLHTEQMRNKIEDFLL